MAFFQLRTFPGNAWPPFPVAAASSIWVAYLELDRTQWLDPAQITEGQLAQVRTLLAHCREQVPYYRDLIASAGIDPHTIQTLDDFRRIPILRRRTYQEQYPRMQAASLPPGMTPGGAVHTSGSSGVPIEIRQTNVVGDWWFAFYLRDAEWCGIDQRGSLAAIRFTAKKGAELQQFMLGLKFPTWGEKLHALIETGPCYGMDINQDPRRQLEWLRRIGPNYLLSFPSNLDFLAGLLGEEGGRIPGLRAIQAIGETLTDEVRGRIEHAFGVPVKNVYSCFEAGAVASACPEGHGLHVHAENVLLEVLDADDRPCAPGQTGRVVLTTLHNFLTPFIRYDILDDAELGPERCPCGRGLPLLSRVFGRRHPMFQLPDGRWRISSALVFSMRGLNACHQFQIIQRAPDHLAIRVVPNASWNDSLPERVRQMVHEFFEAPVKLDLEYHDRLELAAGGKMPVIVSELR